MKKYLILAPLTLLLTFCAANGAPAAPTADIAAMVSATLTAYVPPQPEIDQAPAPAGGGRISGQISYPAGSIPALKVVAFRVGRDEFFFIETAPNQTSYLIENLPEGKYHIVAYTLGEDSFPAGLAGGYTQAVLCGMGEECTEHGLVDVVVFEGEESTDVNIFDWLQQDLPPMP